MIELTFLFSCVYTHTCRIGHFLYFLASGSGGRLCIIHSQYLTADTDLSISFFYTNIHADKLLHITYTCIVLHTIIMLILVIYDYVIISKTEIDDMCYPE